MPNNLTARTKEKAILKKALASDQAELVFLVGRRRVGKTFLIQTVYKENIVFELTGIQHAPRLEQLQNFAIQLTKQSKSSLPVVVPKNWLAAFYLLSEYVETELSAYQSLC